MKRLGSLLLFAAWMSAHAQGDSPFRADDRVLVLAPHPDDESLGCGGVIQQALAAGASVRVVFLTMGDNNELSFLVYRRHPVLWPSSAQRMGLIRREEALSAAAVLGLPATNLVFLGYPDFGTLTIWERHWGDSPPYRSILLRKTSVPYEQAYRPGAPHKGEEILNDLRAILADFRPTQVFMPHPADHNRDHRAMYLFARVALWDLEGHTNPARWPYLVHHPTWPRPRGLRMTEALTPPDSLTGVVAWTAWPLTPDESARKLAAIQAHKSQVSYSSRYMESFVRANELFGDFVGAAADEVYVGNLDEPPGAPGPESVVIEDRFARIEKGTLLVSLELSRLLTDPASASVLAFGYRRDKPFGSMPKLQIVVTGAGHAVYDQDRRLLRSDVSVARSFRYLTVRIPLESLGNPSRILTTARTVARNAQLDGVSWRIVDVPSP